MRVPAARWGPLLTLLAAVGGCSRAQRASECLELAQTVNEAHTKATALTKKRPFTTDDVAVLERHYQELGQRLRDRTIETRQLAELRSRLAGIYRQTQRQLAIYDEASRGKRGRRVVAVQRRLQNLQGDERRLVGEINDVCRAP